MIKINREESIEVRKQFPNAHIAIVNRQSSHKKYYLEEDDPVVKWIYAFRNGEIIRTK